VSSSLVPSFQPLMPVSQMALDPPWRNVPPNSTTQTRPPPSATTASLVSPGKPGKSPNIKKPNPWPIQPTAKDATSRVFKAIEYPSITSTPNASSSPASRTGGLGGSKTESQSNPTSKRPDDSTSERPPSIERASNTQIPVPSTSQRTPPSSKNTQQASKKAAFEERAPTLGNHTTSSTPHRSSPVNKITKETPSRKAPSEEQKQTPVAEKLEASTSNQSRNKGSEGSPSERAPSKEPMQPSVAPNPKASARNGSPTRNNRPKESPSGSASLPDRVQTPVVEISNSPTPRQSSGGRPCPPKKSKSNNTPSIDPASAAKVSTGPTSTAYDKQTSRALPNVSDRDAMVLASEIQPEGSKARPSEDFQSKPGTNVKTSKSSVVPKTPDKGASVSQDARNTSSATGATLKLTKHSHTADGGKTIERKQQTPKNHTGAPIKLLVVEKAVLNASKKGAARTNTTADPQEVIDDHINRAQPADGQALHSNGSTPGTTSGSPFHHKHTQSLPENQSQKMGADILDPTRPAFEASSPKNTLDLPGPLPDRMSPARRMPSGGIVKKTPESDKRKSQSRQSSFGGQMNGPPEAFGQNNYGVAPYGPTPYGPNPYGPSPYGPPAAPLLSMTMGPTSFGPPAPPFQQYPPYMPPVPQTPIYAMHPGHLRTPGYMNPPISPMMNTFGNYSNMAPPGNAPTDPKPPLSVRRSYNQTEAYHNTDKRPSEVSGTYDNGQKKRATIGWQEGNSPRYTGADSLPRTPHEEHKSIAGDKIIPKVEPISLATNNMASGSPKVDLDNAAQVEVLKGPQVDGPGGNDDVGPEPLDVELDDAPPDVAPVNIESNNSDDVVDDPDQQLDSNHENPPSDHSDHGQGNNLEGAGHMKTLLAPPKPNGTGSEPLTKTESTEEDPTNASRRLEYPGTFCTFCTRKCPTDDEKAVSIICPGCGPRSNICYCSEACIVGDAYDHKVHCQMFPTSQRMLVYKIPSPGCHVHKDPIIPIPILPMEPFNDSPEKFRQKTFMMYCPEGPFPKILEAWGRRECNRIPEDVDVDENGKQAGSYFVFRSSALMADPEKDEVYLFRKGLSVKRFNHNADVIFVSHLCHLPST
jgi:hypothetical protein